MSARTPCDNHINQIITEMHVTSHPISQQCACCLLDDFYMAIVIVYVVRGHKEQRAMPLVRRGLLANVSAGVSVTTECLSGGKWLLYTMALWP